MDRDTFLVLFGVKYEPDRNARASRSFFPCRASNTERFAGNLKRLPNVRRAEIGTSLPHMNYFPHTALSGLFITHAWDLFYAVNTFSMALITRAAEPVFPGLGRGR
jgi:hypothetical protein